MWDDFDDPYFADNKYVLVLIAIMGMAGKVKKEGNERISW